ncbi:MAG: HD domain-containing phosphohydrolase [Acidithiobacillales bacterium]
MLAPEDEKPYADFLAVLRKRWQPAKAAIYTFDQSGFFRLKSQFGFSRTDRLPERFSRMDPLATHIYEHREPFFVNSLRQAGKLVDLLEGASTTRLLTSPIYLDGRIIGIVDVRDKAGRIPFTHEDVLEMTDLLRRFAVLLKRHPQYRPEGIMVETASGAGATPPPDMAAIGSGMMRLPHAPQAGPSGAAFEAASLDTGAFRQQAEVLERSPSPMAFSGDLPLGYLGGTTAQTIRLVEEALSRLPLAKPPLPPAPGTLPGETEFFSLYLQTYLRFPEVEVAVVSIYTPVRLEVIYASSRPLAADLKPALLENLEKVAGKPSPAFPLPSERVFRSLDVAVSDSRPVRRAEVAAIQSSVLASASEGIAIFSLLYRHGPSAENRETLRPAHVVLKNALSEIRNETLFREVYRGLVNKLVEPGLRRRTALKSHSFNVGRLARKLAGSLGLAPLEVEQMTVAGILHDVGLRELNYDELYTKRSLTDDEVRLIRQHPRVGAHLVEEIAWPYPVAPLVRHHHERWDGAGYPDGLKGERIPLGSRIIHVCEAFDAMTSPTSYRPVISEAQALDIIESKAGTQFDPDLAPRFKKMIEGRAE